MHQSHRGSHTTGCMLRGPMHLCACVSGERGDGEVADSQALSLLSEEELWDVIDVPERVTSMTRRTPSQPGFIGGGKTDSFCFFLFRPFFWNSWEEMDYVIVMSSSSADYLSRGFFHYLRAAFSSMIKSKVGNILAKTAALRINLNLDGVPMSFKSHTHPSHSQTSRLLTSSLPLGIPVPRPTQCLRGV